MSDHPGKIAAIREFLDLAAEVENAVSQVYRAYSFRIEEDLVFWRRLAQEEKHHAKLIQSLEPILKLGLFPEEMIPTAKLDFKKNLDIVRHHLEEIKQKRLSRKQAFKFAMIIEQNICEVHLHKFMSIETDNKLIQTMQELGRADINHIKRLRRRMKSIGIDQAE